MKISSNCSRKTNLVEIAQDIYERGVRSMETFERFAGIEQTIGNAIRTASRESFGMAFRAIEQGDTLSAHSSNRDGYVSLSASWYVAYGGIFDMLAKPGSFSIMLSKIRNVLNREITRRYPGCVIHLTHRYAHNRKMSLQLTVDIAPAMPGVLAA